MGQKHIDARIRAAKVKANVIIAEFKRERDAKGYCENLGCDRRPELVNCMHILCVPYPERCQILAEFDQARDNLWIRRWASNDTELGVGNQLWTGNHSR